VDYPADESGTEDPATTRGLKKTMLIGSQQTKKQEYVWTTPPRQTLTHFCPESRNEDSD